MEMDDLHVGMTVRVIDWDSHRPDHWCEEGRMDDWRGAVVTKADFLEKAEEVYIEDDEGEWIWYPWDFEPYHKLSIANPNMRYKRHKQDIRMAKMKMRISKNR